MGKQKVIKKFFFICLISIIILPLSCFPPKNTPNLSLLLNPNLLKVPQLNSLNDIYFTNITQNPNKTTVFFNDSVNITTYIKVDHILWFPEDPPPLEASRRVVGVNLRWTNDNWTIRNEIAMDLKINNTTPEYDYIYNGTIPNQNAGTLIKWECLLITEILEWSDILLDFIWVEEYQCSIEYSYTVEPCTFQKPDNGPIQILQSLLPLLINKDNLSDYVLIASLIAIPIGIAITLHFIKNLKKEDALEIVDSILSELN